MMSPMNVAPTASAADETVSASGRTPPAIETTDLVKRYGRITALDGLSMRVERGEVFGFLGPNGAGKTTVVKILLGLARATAGSARVLGRPAGEREARRRIGYLPELFRYQPWLRAREVLALHAELAGMPVSERSSAIADALELVGLTERANDQSGTFSKGMQQRLGLGAALLGRPDLVFLDEPTSALDPVGRADVRRIVRAVRERGTTVFLNSHLLGEVEQVCDRVAVIDRGRVVAAGTLDELLGERTVRVRATALPAEARAGLARFGPLHLEDPADPSAFAVRPIDPERIPELAAAIVAAGGRIHALEPGRASLEARFLDLLGRGEDGEALGMDGGPR